MSIASGEDFILCGFGDFLCKWKCRVVSGRSGGSCDDNDDCACEPKAVENFVCGNGTDSLGHETSPGSADDLCAGWCQLNGRKTG